MQNAQINRINGIKVKISAIKAKYPFEKSNKKLYLYSRNKSVAVDYFILTGQDNKR